MDDRHDITRYLRIETGDLKPESPLPCDLYLYLKKNRRVILYRKKGAILEENRISNFREKGFEQLYVKEEDIQTFHSHIGETPEEVFGVTHEDQMLGTFAEIIKEQKRPSDDIQIISEPRFEGGPGKNTFIVHDHRSSREISQGEAEEIFKIISEDHNRKHSRSIEILKGTPVEPPEETLVVRENSKEQEDDFKTLVPEPKSSGDESTVDGKTPDSELFIHSRSVATKTIQFAKALGFDRTEILQVAGTAGLLHDLGLTGLPKRIRNTPMEKLSPGDRSLYEKHPELSLEIIKKDPGSTELLKTIIYQHHENFDGTGFPQGLRGGAIHELARILAIADALDHFIHENLKTPLKTLPSLKKLQTHNRKSSVCKLDPILLAKIINSLTPVSRRPDEKVVILSS